MTERTVRRNVEGQTLEKYLQSFTEEEIKEIFRIPESLLQFRTILEDSFGREDSFGIISHANNVDHLLMRILYLRRLEPEGQSLAEYLQSFTEEEINEIFKDPELVLQFATSLKESFGRLEGREDCYEIINRANNVDLLLLLIRRLEPVRRRLLEQLKTKAKEIEQFSRVCTVGRFLSSSVDIAGTIGGLWMKETNPGFANCALTASTAFGLLGVLSTAAQMSISKNCYEESIELLRVDEEYFEPIHLWYQSNTELEQAMLSIFPFNVTRRHLEKFAALRNNDVTPVRKIAELIKLFAENYPGVIPDEMQIRNIIFLATDPAFLDLLEWIIFRRHPVILDISRVLLQLQFNPLKFALCQSIPALSVSDQSITSVPVLGRIGLNLITMADSVRSLTRSEISIISMEMENLRRHLELEFASLQRIAEFVQSRRSNQEHVSS